MFVQIFDNSFFFVCSLTIPVDSYVSQHTLLKVRLPAFLFKVVNIFS